MLTGNGTHSGAEFYNMGLMVMNKSFAKYLRGQTSKEFIQDSEFKDFVDGVGFYKWSTDPDVIELVGKKSTNESKKYGLALQLIVYPAVEKHKQKESYFVPFL